MATIEDAINAISPTTEFSCNPADSTTGITWLSGSPISAEDLEAKKAELQAAEDALAYARSRGTQYPSLKEFAEAYTEKEILADTTKWDEYVVKYNKVRTDNPKS
jgi:hypothetical protein